MNGYRVNNLPEMQQTKITTQFFSQVQIKYLVLKRENVINTHMQNRIGSVTIETVRYLFIFDSQIIK